jgi:glucose-1-phosphate thymidylyltransferase
LPNFKKLLGDGSIGCEFSYAEQAIPNGLAQALGKILLAMIVLHYGLGDNIFFEF